MDPYELSVRRQLGLDAPEEDEGSDIFQPIRTFFGATQGAIPAALSGAMPEEYAAAQEEMRQNLGVDENAPWYEQTEALPGAGDVAAQFISPEVRESLPGRIVGPVARLAGNILGDPTTYTPAILGKAAKGIAALGGAGKTAALADDALREGTRLARALPGPQAAEAISTLRRAGRASVVDAIEKPLLKKAYLAAETMKLAEPYAMGGAAALGYGRQVAEGVWGSGKETLAAIGEGDVEGALVSGANTALMAGLGSLMAKGILDVGKARSVLTRELADQGVIPADVTTRTPEGLDVTTGLNEPFIGPTIMPDMPRSGLAEPTLQAVDQGGRLARMAAEPELAVGDTFDARPTLGRPRVEPPAMPAEMDPRLFEEASLELRLQKAREDARAQFLAMREQELAAREAASIPGQADLPLSVELTPREPAPVLPSPVRSRRGRAKQVPLQLDEGIAPTKPPTVDDQIRAVLADPAAQSLIDEQMRQGRISMEPWRRLGETKLRTIQKILKDPTHPQHQAELEHLQQWALAQTTARLRKQIRGGLDPAAMLQKLRDDAEAARLDAEERLAIQEEGALPVEPAPVAEPAPVTEPTVAAPAPRIEPVTTEPAPTTPEPSGPIPEPQAPATETPPAEPSFARAPETPVAKAMAEVPTEAIPEAWRPSPEGAHRPLAERAPDPAERLESALTKIPKDKAEREYVASHPELQNRIATRTAEVKELVGGRELNAQEVNDIVFGEVRKLLTIRRTAEREASKPKAVAKVEPPVVRVEEPVDVPSPEGTQSQLGELSRGNLEAGAEGRAPGAGGQTGSRIRATTEGPGGPGPKVAAQERAAKGGTLSPAAAKWHDVAWPAVRESGVTIEQVLDRYPEGVIREADRLKLRSQRDKFVEFQKLYDQGLAAGKTPFQARKDAIATMGGGQHLRNMIGLVEKFLGDEVVKAAAASKGVKPPATKALPAKAGLEGLLERKQGLDRQLAAFTTKPPDKAVVQEFLSNYMALVAARKAATGGRSMGRTPLAKALGDAELQNWAKFLDVKVKDKASAEVVARAIASHFGVDLAAPPKVEAPVVKTRAAEAAPTQLPEGWKGTKARNEFLSPNGTRVTIAPAKGGLLDIHVYDSKGSAELADDIEQLMKSGQVLRVLYGKNRPKGWGAAISKVKERLGDTVDLLEVGDRDGLVMNRSVAGMETTNLLDVAGVNWAKRIDFDEVMVGPEGEAPDARALADHMAEPDDAWKTVEPIAKSMGLTVDKNNPVTPVGREGSFHQLYLLNGEKDGQQFVMRVGKSPYLELPRPDQKALVNLPVKAGEFKAVTGERFTYTVHPFAWSPGFDITLRAFPNRAELVKKFQGYYDTSTTPNTAYEQAALARIQGRLPDGIGLYDYLDDAAKLNAEIDRTGLYDADLFVHQRRVWRSGQTGYVKLKPGEAPSGVVRVTPDGSRYKLVVLDLGSVRPLLLEGGQWGDMPRSNFVALRQADETLPLAQQKAIERQLFDETAQGLDLGDGLVVANHHGAFGMGYTALTGKHGAGAARGMKAIFDDLVSALGPKTKVEFGGLTTSPYLRGMYAESPAGAKVFANVVEAVYKSSSYEDAVDRLTYTLVHEVAHMAEKGNTHGGKFTDLQRYIENLAKAEDWQAGARQKLKDAGFDEAAYRKIQEDLVGQFDEAWREIRGRDWRNPEAQGAPVEGVPARGAAGSAAAKQGVTGGGSQAPPGGGGAGVRPGRALPGGGEREAGGVRPGAAAGQRDAAGPAQGAEVGSLAREGSDPTESFIAGLESRDERLTYDSAKKLLDDLVKRKAIPVTQAQQNAWDMADSLVKSMSDDEVAKLMKSAPDPRGRPGVIAGGINLLYDVPGVSDRGKARMVTFANLMDDAGLTARSKVRSWDKVEKEVRELLGMTTPEEYVKAFQHKGGGITDTEHMALVTVRDELSRHTDYVEGQWQKAVESGDTTGAERLFQEYRDAAKNEMAAITLAQQKLTGAARALAVGRHERLRLNPQDMLRANLRAGILERLRTRIKDEGKARAEADRLVEEFYKIQERRGNWSEFQKALNLAMGRTGLRGNFYKVLEFYKAGLLGWPSEVANITSNSLFRASRFGEDTIAGLLDAGAYKAGLTKERSVFAGEAKVGLMAARDALAEAFKPLIESEARLFKLEGGDMAKLMQSGNVAIDDLMMAGGMIEGKLGNFLRFHFDSMQNWDTAAKHLARTDSLYRDIYRGLRKGEKWLEARKKTGESIEDTTRRVAQEIKENQAKLSKGEAFDGSLLHYSREMLERADKFASQDTFQAELGNAGRGIQSFLREHPALQFLIPFYRTPTNIFKETLDRTPFGFAKAAFKWKDMTPAERMQALSKPTMGSAILGAMATMAMTGEITGGGPMSFEEQEALRATGWQPYSVRVGDQWISYQRMEPMASLIGMAADAVEAGKNGDMETMSGAMQKLADSIAENLTNKTFLSGLSSLTGAISDPKRELGNFVKQMQGSVVPNSLGFVPFGHLARAIDPVYREAEPMTLAAFQAKIPFASQRLAPAYGPTGEERMRPGGALERAFSPFARRTVEEGPKARGSEEIVRVKAVPKAPMRYWVSPQGFRVPLKPEERQALAKALEEATTLIGQRIVKDPTYQRLPKDELDPNYRYGQMTKQDMLQKLIGKYRSRALKQIMPELKQRSRQMYREREV